MPAQRQSQKRLRRRDQPADDGTIIRILEIFLHWDALTLAASLLVFVVSTPWLLLSVFSLAAAGILCALLIRFGNRKDSLLVFRAGHL